MARRVLLGKDGSNFVLKISKSGDDIIDDTINDRDLLFNSEIYRAGVIRSNTSFSTHTSGQYQTFPSTTDANGNYYIPAYLVTENGMEYPQAVFDYGTFSNFGLDDFFGYQISGLPSAGGGAFHEFSLASSGTNRNRMKPQYIALLDAEDPRPGQQTGYPYIEDRGIATGDSLTVKVTILGIPCQYGKMVNNTTLFGNSTLTGTASGGGGSGGSGGAEAPSAPTATFVSRTSFADTLSLSSTAGSGNTDTIFYIATTSLTPPNIAAQAWQTSSSISVARGNTYYFWAKQGSYVSNVHSTSGYVSPAYDGTPNQFTFTDESGVPISTTKTSNTITVAGVDNNDTVGVAISGGSYSKNGGAYTTNVFGVTAANGDTFSVRQTSSSSFNTSTNCTLTLGTVSDTYTVTTGQDTTVDAYDFTDQTGLELSTLTYSNTETITGITTGVSVSISGNSAQFSINGGAYTTSGTITNNQTLRLRMNTSSSYSTQVSTTVNVGGVTDVWRLTTRAQSPANTPASITATQTTNTTAANQTVDATATHQFLGQGTLQVSNDNTNWYANGTDFTHARNSTVTYYARSQGTDGNTSNVINTSKFVPPVVTLSGIGNFTNMSASGFNNTYNVTSQRAGGNYDTYSSYWGTTTVTISDNASWLTTSITNSSLGYFNLTAGSNTTGSSRTATVTYTTSTSFGASHTMTFTVTQLSFDGTPDQFTFTDVTNQSINSLAYATATITGIDTTVTATYSGDTGGFRVGFSGSFTTTPKTLTNNQIIQVQLNTSSSYGTSTNATISIGGVSDTFTATTIAADSTPDAFSFTDQTGVSTSATIYSNTITISGINVSTTASISGNSAEMSVNGGTYTTSNQTISNGDTIRLRMTSSSSTGTAVSTTLTVGGVSDTWSVTTTTATILWSHTLFMGSFSATGFLAQGYSSYIGGGFGTSSDTSCDLFNGTTTWSFYDTESAGTNTQFAVASATSNSGWTYVKIYSGTSSSGTLLSTQYRSNATYSNPGGSFATWTLGGDYTASTGNLYLEWY